MLSIIEQTLREQLTATPQAAFAGVRDILQQVPGLVLAVKLLEHALNHKLFAG